MQIKSSNIKQAKFTAGLREFGLGDRDIELIESRTKYKKGFTGTYLVDGQEFGFSSDDGIDDIIIRNLAGGFKPSSGSYDVSTAAGTDSPILLVQ